MTPTEALQEAEFYLQPKPPHLPCALRPLWRIAVLVLLVEQCRGGKATLEQLHALNWAIRSNQTRRRFLDFLLGQRAPSEVNVRRDPSLSRALEFALAEGLIGVSVVQVDDASSIGHIRVSLAPKGQALAQFINATSDCFLVERSFLREIGNKLTQSDVAKLFSGVV